MKRIIVAFVVVLLLLSISLASTTQERTSQGQEAATQAEFDRQWKEVQEKYPLVAKAFLYLQNIPLGNLCEVDEVCFDFVQQSCLATHKSPKLCLELAIKACCEPRKFKM